MLNYRTGSSIYAFQVYTFLEKKEINILKSDCNRRSWSSQYQRTILYERTDSTVLNLKSYITWNNNIQKRNFTRRISSHVFFNSHVRTNILDIRLEIVWPIGHRHWLYTRANYSWKLVSKMCQVWRKRCENWWKIRRKLSSVCLTKIKSFCAHTDNCLTSVVKTKLLQRVIEWLARIGIFLICADVQRLAIFRQNWVKGVM